MTQNAVQIALVTWSFGLWLGHVGTLLFDRYRKGGERDLQNWVDAEVEQNVKLLKENETLRCNQASALVIESGKTYLIEFTNSVTDGVAERFVDIFEEKTGAKLVVIWGASLARDFSNAGAGKGEGVESGHVDTPSPSAYAWVCEKRGHRYEAHRNPTDSVHRLLCINCGKYSDGAA